MFGDMVSQDLSMKTVAKMGRRELEMIKTRSSRKRLKKTP